MSSINSNNNNSIQFLYYLSAVSTATGPITTQHRVDTSNYIMGEHNIKSKTNSRQALGEKHINAEK
jgi:hypothetical protein